MIVQTKGWGADSGTRAAGQKHSARVGESNFLRRFDEAAGASSPGRRGWFGSSNGRPLRPKISGASHIAPPRKIGLKHWKRSRKRNIYPAFGRFVLELA